MSIAFTVSNIGKSIGPLGLSVVLALLGAGPMFVLLGAVGGGLGIATMIAVHRWEE